MIEIIREDLIGVLSKVKPGLAKKEIVEEATRFVFTDDTIMTFNDQIAIICPFKTGLECSIPADTFYKIIGKISAEKIKFNEKENSLSISGGKTKGNIEISTGEEIRKRVDATGAYKINDWKKLPKDFIDGLYLCLFSVSNDASDILFNISFDGAYITSSDDVRISEYEFENGDLGTNFLLPGSAAMELVKFSPEWFYVGKSWVYFKTKEDIIFCSRIIDEEYPNFVSAFDFEGTELILPEGLKKAVETAEVLADGDFDTDKWIMVEVDKNKIRCRGERDSGWIEYEMETKFKGDRLVFEINPAFFKEVLDKTETVIIGEDRAIFTAEGFKHLISLPVE